MSVYIPHMNSMQSIVQAGTLLYLHLTLLAYAPEQACLPHLICISHCTNAVAYM